jgi:hypothetical protein
MRKSIANFLIAALVVAFVPGQSLAVFHHRANMDGGMTAHHHEHGLAAGHKDHGHKSGITASSDAVSDSEDGLPCSKDPGAKNDCCWAACAGVGFIVVSVSDPARDPEPKYDFAIARLLTPATPALDAPPPR